MSVPGCYAQGLGTRHTVIHAIVFLAELFWAAGYMSTVDTVVGAVAVAALLAFPVGPKSVIGGEMASVANAATVTASHTQSVTQRKTILALATLLAWERTRLFRHIQVGTGQRAGSGAFIKMTVLWTGKS